MKIFNLPTAFIKFWYWGSLNFFLRLLNHTVLYLEEDLAVKLMLRLLFVPLFHDSSKLGRVLSFFFRLSRVLIGGLAIVLATIFILSLLLGWLILPIAVAWTLLDLSQPAIALKVLLVASIVWWLEYYLTHPALHLHQIIKAEDVWKTTLLTPEKTSWQALLKTRSVINLLQFLELTPEQILEQVKPDPVMPQAQLELWVWELGKKLTVRYLGPEHFFACLLMSAPHSEQLLMKLNITEPDLLRGLELLDMRAEYWRRVWVWDEDFKVHHLKGTNRGWLSAPTPELDRYSRDLTVLASKEQQEEFLGRHQVVDQLINTLSLEKDRNVILVGPPGSGKTALLHWLAAMIVQGDAPTALATKRLVVLDINALLSGIDNQGELADRLKNIFDEVSFSGQVIVCIEEIESLGIGQVGNDLNLYSLLLPYIESGGFQFIATAQPEFMTTVVEKNGAFARLFHKISLPEASVEETMEILMTREVENERRLQIQFSIQALKGCIELSERYRGDHLLPDSALQTFEESKTRAQNGWVTYAIVSTVVQADTGIPTMTVQTQKNELLHLEETIHQQFIDQEEAVATIATALRRSAAELTDRHRPTGSFLFVGPTGVGKTEISKVLSKIIYQGQMIRFDMSEYQTTDSVLKLRDLLSESVRQHPYSLILLDEFEKADPKILNLFLQVLDDGRISDSFGKTVDFSHTMIIATSNAGSIEIARGATKEQLTQILIQQLRPELVNRFDEVVMFKPLSQENLAKIVRLKLQALQEKMKKQGYNLDFSEELVAALAQRGFDPVMGARPLRRLIQDTLEAHLATKILEGKLVKGEVVTLSKELLSDMF